MPELQSFLVVATGLGLAALGLILFFVFRPRSAGPAARALAAGDFEAAARAVAIVPGSGGRDELLAGAVGAKHLGRYELAESLLRQLLDADPNDGEAWFEKGSVAAYRNRTGDAEEAFARVLASRSDLLEPLTLHRAWLALAGGDRQTARRRFEEIEASLETKLRQDLGTGEPSFAEWFLQAAALWRATGHEERAAWAEREGRRAAPASRLPEIILAAR